MAVFRTFRALRPTKEKAEKVAALPYDVVSREEAGRLGKENKDSFLHVDRAEIDLEPVIALYDLKVYEKARENLNQMAKDGSLVPCSYNALMQPTIDSVVPSVCSAIFFTQSNT